MICTSRYKQDFITRFFSKYIKLNHFKAQEGFQNVTMLNYSMYTRDESSLRIQIVKS